MGLEHLSDCSPGAVYPTVLQGLLYGYQKMVGQNAKKNVRPHTLLQLVKDGPLGQGTFHAPKGPFPSGQKRVNVPGFFSPKIAPVGLEKIAAVKLLCH
jgi:hypothetical protein